MGIVFGPVPSRRYGISLGLDIIPKKTCSFNCLFCEVGETNNLTIERKPFVRLEELKNELDAFFEIKINLDVITFAGSGEPTLNSEIGRMISYLKNKYKNIPIVVLTNGSLFWMKEVREELLYADIVEPSFNAFDEQSYVKLTRPEKNIIFPLYLEGLIKFREEYRGKYFLEIFLVKGINDDERDIGKWNEVINKIRPDRIHLNTVDRPPALNCEPVSIETLLRMKNLIGEKAKIIYNFNNKKIDIKIEEFIRSTTKIRPLKIQDIYSLLNRDKEEIDKIIRSLKEKGVIKEVEYNGEKYIQGI